jgi:hypothetical protein
MNRKMIAGLVLAVFASISLTGCANDADVVSKNISNAADNFEVQRRIVFYNGITGAYVLTIEGLCSLGNDDPAGRLTVTCKTGTDAYKKHFLGLSDNVTYFVEQTDAKSVDKYHYAVTFKPSTIIPDINVR